MKVLYWGTPAFALPALRALGGEGHDVVGVVTQPDRPAGRGRVLAASPVKKMAIEEGIPILQPTKASDPEFLAQLRDLGPEISVVVAYGQILGSAALDLPVHGSVNIHASLLPALRGAAPIHRAIMEGHETTGVTIMRMDAGLDSGPILYQVAEPVKTDESAAELATRLAEIGAGALIEALALLEAGELVERPQDDSRATYARKLDREIAHVDWTRPALEVGRWIRGLDSTPGAWNLLDGQPVKLFSPRTEIAEGTPGEVLEADEKTGVLVAAGRDAVRIREAQPSGKRRMTAGEWIRGRGVRVGDHLE